MRAVMAVDVGSGSARAGIFDAAGRCHGRAAAGFDTQRPVPDHAEHSFDGIWAAVCAATRGALDRSGLPATAVAGLAFDATCSLAVFDAAGEPVTVSTAGEDRWNVVMWADHRAIAEAEEITASGHRALRHVGGVMSPEMELPKLLWLKRHLPGSWNRMALALDLADALTWRATGRVAVSVCTATCKWAFLNHEEVGWQEDLLSGIGLEDFHRRTGQPDRTLPIGTPVGPLAPAAAEALGLTTGCILGVGLIDAHAGGLGLLGGFEARELNRRLAMIAGTSTCHMAASPEPRFVPGLWGPYDGAMIPGTWLNEGGQSATGALLDHLLDWHAEGRALGPDRHDQMAARITDLLAEHGPAMAEGLRVLPDFNGNRSPVADPASRGVIEGLTLDSSFDSLARLYYAAAVGIALGTRHIVSVLNAHGYTIDTLHLAGGHVANPVLLRLYADATDCRVVVRDEVDSILAGTACVAATAAGLQPSLRDAARAASGGAREILPDPATQAHFAAEFGHFLRLQGAAR
ncbi:FGGY-family carbohydrate kinase [Roseomonas sp. BN140053]|uniref:FGGY-family carbohydrate kinase n=1 Tax=Roseomonas sp. BN140053 TaxID=3391898 RepID=UPI0039E9AB4A